MFKKVVSLLLFSGFTYTFAQVSDSVVTGPQNSNDVFYSLENGVIKTEPNNNWDLAFEIAGFSASVRVNHVKGMEVYQSPYPSSGWSKFDSTGKNAWEKLYNSQYTWTLGAFNRHTDGNFDLGWGVYNPGNHIIAGDSIYLVKLGDGSFVKLTFINLNSGVYNFKYAKPDGSGEKTISVSKADYKNKNFIYYSFTGDAIIDREPPTGDYDLVFTKYLEFIPTPYAVAGVWTNKGTQAAEARNVPVNTENYFAYHFSDTNSVIGYDWKTYNQSLNKYEITSDLVYFVNPANGSHWKIVFTGYKGGNNGTYYFNKKALIGSVKQSLTSTLKVYPNPAQNVLNIETKNGILNQWLLADLNGKTVMTGNTNTLDINEIPSGVYFLNVQIGETWSHIQIHKVSK